MERINYVDRAKRIMAQTVRTGALVIVPLAAAVQLHATTTYLPDGSPQCEIVLGGNEPNDSCGPTVAANPLPGSVLTGVDLSYIGAGGAGPSGGVSNGKFWSSTWTDTFSASGDLSGSLTMGELIPLVFDFTMTTDEIGGWSLEFELGTMANAARYGTQTFSGSQSGSGTLAVNSDLADGSPLVESVVLTFTGVEDNQYLPYFLLTDPDFQFGAISSAPEPSSAGLLAAGLGFLGWLFRRRRRAE